MHFAKEKRVYVFDEEKTKRADQLIISIFQRVICEGGVVDFLQNFPGSLDSGCLDFILFSGVFRWGV